MFYAETFRKLQPTHDPRHIEAFVRARYNTLCHLDMSTLRREAQIAADCIAKCGADKAEQIAQSFGL